MLSLQEISDRLEIQQLMIDYSSAIDGKSFDILDRVFTPDAYIDYRAMGGVDGKYPFIKDWLKQAMQNFPTYQHMVGNMAITITGDTGTGRTICFNPMVMPTGGGKTQVMLLGLWYIDKYVRTPAGWRISERVEEKCFDYNVPTGLKVSET